MKKVKLLGAGCRRCEATADLVRVVAKKLGIAIELEKVADYETIARSGYLATPVIFIDGAVVHVGGMPKAEDVAKWLAT